MSLKNYIIFDTSGKIVKTVRCPESMKQYQKTAPSDVIIEGVAKDTESYVDVNTKTLVEKQSFDFSSEDRECVADGVDSVTFSGLPVGCEINVCCAKWGVDDNLNITDGELIFSTNYAGVYYLKFYAPFYKAKRVSIHAISARRARPNGPETPSEPRDIRDEYLF